MQDWLKLHTDLLDNPDVALISPLDFQIFTFLMLLCRREGITDGRLVGWDYPRLSYRIRKSVEEIENSVTRLKRDDVHWLNLDENGVICIVNYGVRQYGKLSATPEKVRERVKRLRNRGNDTELEPVTPVSRDGNAPVTRSNAVEEKRVDKNRREENIKTSGADAPGGGSQNELEKSAKPKHNEQDTYEMPAKAQDPYHAAIEALELDFSKSTGLPLPPRETKPEQKSASLRWWTPLGLIWHMAGDDTAKAKNMIRNTVAYMTERELTFDAPASIVRTCRSQSKTVQVDYDRSRLKAGNGVYKTGNPNAARGSFQHAPFDPTRPKVKPIGSK